MPDEREPGGRGRARGGDEDVRVHVVRAAYRRSAGTAAYSANDPCRPWCPRLLHQTGCPAAKPVPAPASATSPTRSRPMTDGTGIGVR
ncbi:hypothetical protein GCM10010182_40750 [Actinomadura cremea]|nr:hypothetical protein GCM10010182_40750 [Actinomadura cremea]